MGDVLTPEQRSHCMSRNRGVDTTPEVVLRKALWGLGLRYTLRSTLPGRPDLVFPLHRVALFVDGCFWHRCPRHAVPPRSNADFWERKLTANVERDARVNRELRALRWRVIRVWEHEIRADTDRLARKLLTRISKRRGARS